MAQLSIERLTKHYSPDVTALEQVCLDLEAGAFLCVLGPSGSGKTTLLRLIAGLDSVSSGSIRIGDQDVTHQPPEQRDVAMVFQNTPLYPHMTVHQNMAFALKMASVAKSEIQQRVQDAAQWLQIDSLLKRRPGSLSAGQRQRVGIGKALIRRARITLLDEPLSHVDAPLRRQLRQKIRQYQAEQGLSFVWVTHDQVEAVHMADRVCVLHEGCVQQIGPPREILQSPANAVVSEFFMIGLMPAHVPIQKPSNKGGEN
jgi:multiple sugar transport system ATP-binding protein